MTMTADDYINRVLAALPRTLPLRSQIALELRGHIAERVDSGHPVDDVLRRLGDPVKLAESYLSAEPLVSASFGARALAKLVDVLTVVVVLGPVALIGYTLLPSEAAVALLVGVFLIGGSFGFGLYTVLAEYLAGYTLGKKLAGLRVVRESGAPISLGQAIVRQLPMFLQVYIIDVMFALFTERSQRAFELLSQTRVVVTSRNSAKPI
jgi:uncharacterized RDD family membrane protein YckC